MSEHLQSMIQARSDAIAGRLDNIVGKIDTLETKFDVEMAKIPVDIERRGEELTKMLVSYVIVDGDRHQTGVCVTFESLTRTFIVSQQLISSRLLSRTYHSRRKKNEV